VMGDSFRVYATYTAEMCSNMRRLAEKATILTPNVTEAAILLGKDPAAVPERDEMREWLLALSDGKRDVVVTGVRYDDEVHTIWYRHENDTAATVNRPFVKRLYHGTGDLFASVLLGETLRGKSLPDAAESAAEFVCRAAEYTAEHEPESGDIVYAPLMDRLVEIHKVKLT